MSTASQSIARLKSQVCTANSAVNALSSLLALTNILDIFRQCFPREFKKYARGIGSGDSERIIVEFLRLVNDRLFELSEVYLEDEESHDYACRAIPISAFTPDWYNEDPSDLPLAYKVILLLDGDLDESYLQRDRNEVLSRFSPPVRQSLAAPAPVDRSKLQQVCQQTRGPLRDLYLAFEMVFKISPNIWLGMSDEEWCEIPWKIKEVRNLARQYREALALSKRFRRFEEWLEADPDKRVKQVVNLWSKASKAVRVKVPAVPLVDVLTTAPVRVLI